MTSVRTRRLVAAAAATEHTTLSECLEAARVRVLTGNENNYNDARLVFSKFFQNWPAAIAYPRTNQQAAAAVQCALQYGVNVHPRCGGHGNEGESVSTAALTLDMSRMAEVRMAADGKSVRVGTGARVGEVMAKLWTQSNGTRAFPGGQRPSVGVSGYSLGGGFGAVTRWAGLAADNLIALTAVDGRGRTLHANASQHADLLWAARGAGGGRFFVATTFWFRTVDVSMSVTEIHAKVPPAKAVEAVYWYQSWQDTLPSKFTTRADYTTTEDGQVTVDINGWCMGPLKECRAEMDAALPKTGPIADLFFEMNQTSAITAAATSYLDAAINGIGWPVPNGWSPMKALEQPRVWDEFRSYYKYKSLILNKPLSRKGIRTVLEYAKGGVPGSQVFVFEALGGAMRQVPDNATAAANLRRAANILVFRANSANESVAEAALQAATETLVKLIDQVPQYQAYINFLDTDVPALAPSWQQAYYGDAYHTLQCINDKYDPQDVFTLPLELAVLPRDGMPSPAACRKALKRVGARAAAWSRSLARNAPARG